MRIATFNCENLFSRPKIFASPNSDALLKAVADLTAELRRQVFDHNRISDLKKRLSGYATVNDLKGKHATANGADEWLGWVELTRRVRDDDAIENTARVVADVDADIFCTIEVESRPQLKRFHDGLLLPEFLAPAGKAPYEHVLVIDGNDNRGIDVGVLSRHPIIWVRTHVSEMSDYNGRRVATFSRDCLELGIQLPSGAVVSVLANHFKSMGYSPANDKLSERRRRGQAERVSAILDANYDQTQDLYVVAGDLNSPSDAWSLQPLLQRQDLYNVNLELPAGQRGTYRTGTKQLDYLLVSRALRQRLSGAGIFRKGTYAKTKWPTYPQVTGRKTAASDHCAVWADFTL